MAINDEIPKSRLTLTYRTTVSGEAEEVQLPFRLVVMGDLSGGTSRDRQVDLDARNLRRLDGKNLDDVISDMKMSVSVNVPNRVDPEILPNATLPMSHWLALAVLPLAAGLLAMITANMTVRRTLSEKV